MEPRLALSSLAIILPFLAKMHDAGHDPIDDAGGSAAADACTRPSRGVGAGCVLIITRIKVESSSRLITVHLNQAFTRRENSHVAGSKHEARLPTTPHTRGQVRWTGRSCPPPSLDLRSRHTARRAPSTRTTRSSTPVRFAFGPHASSTPSPSASAPFFNPGAGHPVSGRVSAPAAPTPGALAVLSFWSSSPV